MLVQKDLSMSTKAMKRLIPWDLAHSLGNWQSFTIKREMHP